MQIITYAEACGDFLGVGRRYSPHIETFDAKTNSKIRPRNLVIVHVKMRTSAFEATMYVRDTYVNVVRDALDEPT